MCNIGSPTFFQSFILALDVDRGTAANTHRPFICICPNVHPEFFCSSSSGRTILCLGICCSLVLQGCPDSIIHLLLRVEIPRRGRCDDLHLDPLILKSTPNVQGVHFLPTLQSAPTISGILILATLPVEMMTTLNMPSGISGLYRPLSNGLIGFTFLAWTRDGPASALTDMLTMTSSRECSQSAPG